VALRLGCRKLTGRAVAEAVGPGALAGIYGIAVALGAVSFRRS